MGLFGKISEAKYSEGGNYLQGPGVYRLQVKNVKTMRTRKGQDAFLVEFSVLESTHTAHITGSDVTWMVTLDKEPAMGNIKQFIATAHDAPIDSVDEASAELVVGPGQPTAGKIVRASAVNIMTKASRPFTKVKFLPDAMGAAAAAVEHAKG